MISTQMFGTNLLCEHFRYNAGSFQWEKQLVLSWRTALFCQMLDWKLKVYVDVILKKLREFFGRITNCESLLALTKFSFVHLNSVNK